jgi:hypothetical protein
MKSDATYRSLRRRAIFARSVFTFVAGGLALAPRAAHAEPAPFSSFAPAASATSDAAREAFLSDLPPAPHPRGPAPLAEEDEHARRPWELEPTIGAGTPICYGASGPLCGAEGGGLSFGASGLFRLTPYVALGVVYQRLGGGVDPAAFAPGVSATAWSDFFGAVARGYFLERGAFDPYVQAGFGRGSYHLDWAADGARFGAMSGAAPATEVTAGADFWIGSFAKVGASLSYFWTFLGDVRTCDPNGCSFVAADSLGAPGTELVLGVSVTFAMGREM